MNTWICLIELAPKKHYNRGMDIRSEVIRAEKAWLQAHLEMDLIQLEALMHPEYTRIQSDGAVWDKTQTLASYQGGKRHWSEASIDQLDVRIYGRTAVVTGRWQAKGVNTRVSFDYAARYTSVWVLEGGRWQMVSDQSTDIVEHL
jgi:hypothetical protein